METSRRAAAAAAVAIMWMRSAEDSAIDWRTNPALSGSVRLGAGGVLESLQTSSLGGSDLVAQDCWN